MDKNNEKAQKIKFKIIMQLSSNCLFHFTNSIEKILKILKSQSFIPSYCKEKNWFDSNNGIYIPQVSFCDVPLSNTSKIQSYGKYAIGLSMDWANRNNLNPTFYLNTNSNIVKKFSYISSLVNSINGSSREKEAKRRLLLQIIGMYSPEIEKLNLSNTPSYVIESLKGILINFLQNTKEYQGPLTRDKHKSIKDYKFYDEKEWRYVPSIQPSDFKTNPKIIEKLDWESTYSEKFKVKPHFLIQNQYHLKFGVDDIEYLIVKNEKDVNKLIKLKSKIKYFDDLLLTKIITIDKINRDF